MIDKVGAAAVASATATPTRAGSRRVHLERPARARRRRQRRWRRSRKSSARGWPPGRRCSATTGDNHPDHWVGGLASPDLHAIVILFARDVAERERCEREHAGLRRAVAGRRRCSRRSTWKPSRRSTTRTEHFGYRDRLSQPVDRGNRRASRRPVRDRPLKAGEFFLGYHDEDGRCRPLPQPEVLSRNGSYLAYLRMEEHVGAFREFLRQHGGDAGGAGADRGEADGTVAQRRAARARAGQGRPGARRRPAADQQLQLRKEWTRTATLSRSARTSGA